VALNSLQLEYRLLRAGALPWDVLIAWRFGLALLYVNTRKCEEPSSWLAILQDRIKWPGEFPEDNEWQRWLRKTSDKQESHSTPLDDAKEPTVNNYHAAEHLFPMPIHAPLTRSHAVQASPNKRPMSTTDEQQAHPVED
jgi:hypothetical protein